ncbi:glycosyltransferase family 2 protein [Clostridium autoethanogenum]|uniref:Glycosyltransferase n=1 Tax=Clostridium autoethanogenum DSM 10061 TaxID=1341692 RepID=A0ABN4BPF6_9CLOT|nr:glycosyltransferase [Clostridium autoethanogenum]AGY78213.1 glycosyltransferase [Clostridium autoethanogenum DSM 10061]ALU38345.1 Glycosyl transferase family 2 [Clostridium autoethanogenum DSM 10061]OVY51108.1 putative glycosyltransferase EpsJ [Clostridium autoethanogenum]
MKEKISYNDKIDVSIIIPCKNEVNNLKWTLDSIMKSKNLLNFEIIVVDDASSDSSTQFLNSDLNKSIYKDIILIKTDNVGVSRARNAGAKIAKGKYLFFCDAHIKICDHLLDNLVSTLKISNSDLAAPCILDMYNSLAVSYGMTWDNNLKPKWLESNPNFITEIPFACGCAFIITKKTFNKIHGFNKIFEIYGSEDFEICLKAWLYGYKLTINPNIKVRHLFKQKHSYKITYSNLIYNMLCLSYFHFKKERIIKTIELLKNNYYFHSASENIKLNMDLIYAYRKLYFEERKYEDDCFFRKFNIKF